MGKFKLKEIILKESLFLSLFKEETKTTSALEM